jgi:predicted O-methyltransferase YrrM
VPYSYDDLPAVLTNNPPRPVHEAAAGTQTALATMRSTAVDESRFVGSVSLAEALRLYTLVRERRPAVTIEIGMFTGASTLAILKALDDNGAGEHHVCDPFQSTYGRGAGLRNVEAAGLGQRMNFVEDFPESAVPGWPVAELAFIDASHMFDLTILDFVLVDKRLAVGGLVGLHDLWMPSLRKVVRWMVTNRGYLVVRDDARELTSKERAWRRAASLLRRMPSADRIWSQELLHPWFEVEPSGRQMVFLQKTRDDDRDWREHRPF